MTKKTPEDKARGRWGEWARPGDAGLGAGDGILQLHNGLERGLVLGFTLHRSVARIANLTHQLRRHPRAWSTRIAIVTGNKGTNDTDTVPIAANTTAATPLDLVALTLYDACHVRTVTITVKRTWE